MATKKVVGRPSKFSVTLVDRVADLISHNYTISDSCRYSKISRSTYYYYLNTEPLFAEKMATAHDNRRKVSFNFRTLY